MRFVQKALWVVVVLFIVIPLLGQFAFNAGVIRSFVSADAGFGLMLFGIFSAMALVVAWGSQIVNHSDSRCHCDNPDLEQLADDLDDPKRRVDVLKSKV